MNNDKAILELAFILREALELIRTTNDPDYRYKALMLSRVNALVERYGDITNTDERVRGA